MIFLYQDSFIGEKVIQDNFFIIQNLSVVHNHVFCPFSAKYLVSCEEARMLNPMLTTKDITIDIDDSGPLEPIPVTCVFQRESQS